MISGLSPAKVNLFFRVLSKRPDGYHEVASFYSAVSLFDKLSLSLSSHDRFACSSAILKNEPSNLVIKALDLFRKASKILDPVDIYLEKNIPIEAGLGGGSSNASTMLYLLNELFQRPLSPSVLINLSSRIGSDTAFFFSSGSAYCEGRGEIVHDVDFEYEKTFWIAKPKHTQLSTNKVFANFQSVAEDSIDPLKILDSFKKGREIFVNDLEFAAFSVEPSLRDFKEKLSLIGFDTVVMTGSGSAFLCFGDIENPMLEETDFYKVSTIKKNRLNWYGDINL
jgi:4-diphosphocytidyl-2-C-methyl-D-erythritol kinase